MTTRASGREPDELRPVAVHPRLHRDGRRLGARRVRAHPRAVHRVGRGARAAVAARARARAGSPPSTRCCRARRPSASTARRRKGKQSGRTQEIQRLIGRSLRAVTDLRLMPDVQITVDCDVLQADGGTRTASICGGWIALHDACTPARRSEASSPRTRSPQPCAAISVGVIDGTPMLDLEYSEDVRAEVDMNVVMTGDGPVRRGAGHRRRRRVHARRARRAARPRRAGIAEIVARSGRWSPSRRAPALGDRAAPVRPRDPERRQGPRDRRDLRRSPTDEPLVAWAVDRGHSTTSRPCRRRPVAGTGQRQRHQRGAGGSAIISC